MLATKSVNRTVESVQLNILTWSAMSSYGSRELACSLRTVPKGVFGGLDNPARTLQLLEKFICDHTTQSRLKASAKRAGRRGDEFLHNGIYLIAEAFMELSSGKPLQPSSSDLQLLPSEVLDLITEKVRRHSPQSFHALGQSCRELRDSARRCAQTLVLKRCSADKHGSMRCTESSSDEGRSIVDRQESDLLQSSSQGDIFAREISLRPGLHNLVMRCDLEGGWVNALSRVSWVSSSFSVCMVKPECKKHGLSQILQILYPTSNDSSGELNLTGFAFPLESLKEILEPLSNLRSLKLCRCEIRSCSDAAGPVTLKELAELDITGTRITQPKEAASEAGADSARGVVFDFPKVRKLTMGCGTEFVEKQSWNEQRLLWEQFPFPRTLEIVKLDCCLGTSPRAWFLMRAVVPKLAASCPALREVYTRSWAGAPFQDSRLCDSNEGTGRGWELFRSW
jgi:hypothetical protein